ncbi:MAG: folate-binding protein YgfZ [Alcaligenaceae bacterium]|jgi:folate-binding protein YgfZ|nr:folate-binding protein YgfZ [Alcaligenaceae bacterium]
MSNSSAPVVNYALLNDFSLVKVSGADAAEFLQSQLTQDVTLANTEQAKLTAWCNAKGRSLASFLFWQDAEAADTYYLVIKKDILEATLKRLRMFVLRNKVVLEGLNSTPLGLWSEHVNVDFTPDDLASKSKFAVHQQDQQSWIRFPSGPKEQRYLVVSTVAETTEIDPVQLLSKVENIELNASDAVYWTAQDIVNATAWVELANKEEFIPQSINFDAIGAVNFKKGCFPGQEVVARSHYRGTLKRRSYIGYTAQSANDIAVGADIFQDDNPIGQIVNIAHLPDDKGTWVLFETRLEAVDGTNDAPLHLGAQDGPKLTVQSPPYALEKPEN